MKVGKLIKILKTYPPWMPVHIIADGDCDFGTVGPIEADTSHIGRETVFLKPEGQTKAWDKRLDDKIRKMEEKNVR